MQTSAYLYSHNKLYYICMCSIIHYGNIDKDTTYLSYLYYTVLYYPHYTQYCTSTAIVVTVLATLAPSAAL